VRAGVFGVTHASRPGVVHFEYCWDLSSAPARTWEALDRGDHPCRSLVQVLARARHAEASSRAEERRRRARGRTAARFGHQPADPSPPRHLSGSVAATTHRAAEAAIQHAAFEIFVVRSFDYGSDGSFSGGGGGYGSGGADTARLPPLLLRGGSRPSSREASYAADVRALEATLRATVVSCQRKHARSVGLALLQAVATGAARRAWARWRARRHAARWLEQCAAALVLQGQVRRRRAQAVARRKHAWRAARLPAALLVQARWRGYAGRRKARAKRRRRQREGAAVRVQAGARGMLARRATRKARRNLKRQRQVLQARRVLARCLGRRAAARRRERARGLRAARRGAATTLAEWWRSGWAGLRRARRQR
jgi:hypothetical protein